MQPEERDERLPELETTAAGLEGVESLPQSVGVRTTSGIMHLLRDSLGGTHAVDLSRGDEAPPADLPPGATGRYARQSEIAAGGMGTVLKAFDIDLRRWVAMKVVRPEVARSRASLSRFVEEAQVGGQLEHPNIPPVHELNRDAGGQVFFTMKLIKGKDLAEVAEGLRAGDEALKGEFTPIRIAQILQQAAMGVHYANVRGVVHRDLKPHNIMLGDYGEVLVVDWGLAKVLGQTEQPREIPEESDAVVVTDRTQQGLATRDGTVQGTPAYMAPEQALGELEAIDARTDVFGLGGVLYTLLCYRPPYPGSSLETVIGLARKGKVPAPSSVAPEGTRVPPDLEAICMRALSARKEDRHASAGEFQEDLQSYIEGRLDRERRRKQSLVFVVEGMKRIRQYHELEKRTNTLRSRAAQLAEKISAHDPIERKRELWAIESEVENVEQEAAHRLSDAKAALDAAIQTDPESREAREALCDLYWSQFEQAEARGSVREAVSYRRLVEVNDDGRYEARLQGDGHLQVETDPPGAAAILHRYAERDRVLVPSDPQRLGTTPLDPVRVPMGSYLLVVEKAGYHDTRYPVRIGRSQGHAGKVRLYTEEEIGDGYVYVPGGEFVRGGDAESGGRDRSRVQVDDFFIARFPVTMGEYCAFLDALRARGEPVEKHIARQGEEVFIELGEDGRYRPRPDMSQGDINQRYKPGFEARLPAFAVNWHSAKAYARWRSEVDGRKYDLPPEDAWEKAARGVDGRYFPWGDRFDWTFAKGGRSRAELAQPEPIGSFPIDQSPYGVRDLAGTIREWTSSFFDRRAGLRALRGGSWSLVVSRQFRCATRFGYLPGTRSSVFGFRLYTSEPLRRGT